MSGKKDGEDIGPASKPGLGVQQETDVNSLLLEAMIEVILGYDEDIKEGVGNLCWA